MMPMKSTPGYQTKKEKESSAGKLNPFYFSEDLFRFFSFLLLSGNEQTVINVRRENLPSLGQLFPAGAIFSEQGRK